MSRSWARARHAPKRKNEGCQLCGARPPSLRSVWLTGAGRVAVCEACAVGRGFKPADAGKVGT